jgi:hypothetical protein
MHNKSGAYSRFAEHQSQKGGEKQSSPQHGDEIEDEKPAKVDGRALYIYSTRVS